MASRKVVLAVDADFFAFQAAAACQRTLEWEDGIVESYGDLEEAKQAFLGSMDRIRALRAAWKDAPQVMCFTDSVNWRKDVWPTYKANRGSKPVVYGLLKAWIMETFESFERPTLEGDDCLGILSTKPSIVDAEEVIIVSPDKDFNTIPGKFVWFDSNGGRHEFKQVTVEQANKWHMLQTLMGDATDNYPGCPGIGPDTARDFLEEPYVAFQEERVLKSGPRKGQSEWLWKKRPLAEGETLWDAIVSLFRKAGLDEQDALVQARVARILRASDFNFRDKQVILWTPDSDKEY